ncbi:unnamed protein product, partial [Symbiodinium microadriaticum]
DKGKNALQHEEWACGHCKHSSAEKGNWTGAGEDEGGRRRHTESASKALKVAIGAGGLEPSIAFDLGKRLCQAQRAEQQLMQPSLTWSAKDRQMEPTSQIVLFHRAVATRAAGVMGAAASEVPPVFYNKDYQQPWLEALAKACARNVAGRSLLEMQYLWTQSPGKCPPIKAWRHFFLPFLPSLALHDEAFSLLLECNCAEELQFKRSQPFVHQPLAEAGRGTEALQRGELSAVPSARAEGRQNHAEPVINRNCWESGRGAPWQGEESSVWRPLLAVLARREEEQRISGHGAFYALDSRLMGERPHQSLFRAESRNKTSGVVTIGYEGEKRTLKLGVDVKGRRGEKGNLISKIHSLGLRTDMPAEGVRASARKMAQWAEAERRQDLVFLLLKATADHPPVITCIARHKFWESQLYRPSGEEGATKEGLQPGYLVSTVRRSAVDTSTAKDIAVAGSADCGSEPLLATALGNETARLEAEQKGFSEKVANTFFPRLVSSGQFDKSTLAMLSPAQPMRRSPICTDSLLGSEGGVATLGQGPDKELGIKPQSVSGSYDCTQLTGWLKRSRSQEYLLAGSCQLSTLAEQLVQVEKPMLAHLPRAARLVEAICGRFESSVGLRWHWGSRGTANIQHLLATLLIACNCLRRHLFGSEVERGLHAKVQRMQRESPLAHGGFPEISVNAVSKCEDMALDGPPRKIVGSQCKFLVSRADGKCLYRTAQSPGKAVEQSQAASSHYVQGASKGTRIGYEHCGCERYSASSLKGAKEVQILQVRPLTFAHAIEGKASRQQMEMALGPRKVTTCGIGNSRKDMEFPVQGASEKL